MTIISERPDGSRLCRREFRVFKTKRGCQWCGRWPTPEATHLYKYRVEFRGGHIEEYWPLICSTPCYIAHRDNALAKGLSNATKQR